MNGETPGELNVRTVVALSDADLEAFAAGAASEYRTDALEVLLIAYLEVTRAARPASTDRTQVEYRRSARRFVVWAQGRGVPLLRPGRRDGSLFLADLARPQARSGRWKAAGKAGAGTNAAGKKTPPSRAAKAGAGVQGVRRGGPLSPATRQKHLAGARALYRALRWAGATSHDPFVSLSVALDATSAVVRHPPYAQGDIDLVTGVLSDRFSEALLLLAAHAGLREEEARELRWVDVTSTDGRQRLTVRGKGGKTREVPLSGALSRALADLERQQTRPAHVLPYFDYWQAVSPLRAAFRRAGVVWRGLHGLRKSAGTRLYARLGDVHKVSLFLGHASDVTTRRYVQVQDDDVEQALASF